MRLSKLSSVKDRTLGYTGKPYDASTGMYNYGYRDYSPRAARFTTVDPIRDGNNWYAYVNNDPVNWVDLWGLFIINNINGPSADAYQKEHPSNGKFGSSGAELGRGALVLNKYGTPNMPIPTDSITLPGGLNKNLATAYMYQTDKNDNTRTTITSKATELSSGNYAISVSVTNYTVNSDGTINYSPPASGIIAYATPFEVGIQGESAKPNPAAISEIANNTINVVNKTGKHDYNVSYSN